MTEKIIVEAKDSDAAEVLRHTYEQINEKFVELHEADPKYREVHRSSDPKYKGEVFGHGTSLIDKGGRTYLRVHAH